MAYPKIHQKLFQGDGAGPLIREDILPTIPEAKMPKAYLPLTGGVMTGAVSFLNSGMIRTSGSGTGYGLSIFGAPDDFSYSRILLYAKSANQAGEVNIIASDGTKSSLLKMTPGGVLQWMGNNIALGKDYLPLSGGTVTGGITLSGAGSLGKGDFSNFKYIFLSASNSSGNGGRFEAFTQDSANNAGGFNCRAISSTGTLYDLFGSASGHLTWVGNSVGVTGRTIILQSGSGNVVTAPSGGTWTGMIIQANSNTDYCSPYFVSSIAGGGTTTLASSTAIWAAIWFRKY